MECRQALFARRSHGVVTPAPQPSSGFLVGTKRLGGLRPSSFGKHRQWQFRVEKRVTLRPHTKSYKGEVRAKKSGSDFKFPGTLKLKKSEEPTDDEAPPTANGTQKFAGSIKLPGSLKLPGSQRMRRKDNNVVFVAGATGKVGRRVVRELVHLGYTVRAGVRDAGKAEFLLEFATGTSKPDEEEEAAEEEKKNPSLWSNFSPEKIFGFLGSAKKEPGVDLVKVDLENADEIEEALGNAGVVVCAIGASEKEALNVTAPYRIDYKATENLINVASDANVNHFVLVTSLGTTKVGWPAAVLNLFWGVLVWKAKAEKSLINSGIPFTIVRPGGMERPTDAYKETHNLVLDKADSRFGGQVSNLQVAELIAGIVGNLKLAQNKAVEAVAETTAPLRPIEELLAEIPPLEGPETEKEANTVKIASKEKDKLAKQEEARAAKQRAEEEKLAKREDLKATKRREEEERIAAQQLAAEERAKAEALRQILQKEYAEAREREEDAKEEAEAARAEKVEIEKRAAELRSRAEAAAQAAREAKALEVAILAAVREGKTLSEKEKRDVVAAVREKAAKEKAARNAEAKAKAEKAKKEEEIKATKEADAANAEVEKKRQAEEARIVTEAEKAAKAEADKKAKAEAEIKAKAKAEEKAKAEVKLKAKAEAEGKAKAEEELKSKAAAGEKVKVESEKKAEEEQLKVEAEAKAKEEEDKLKAETEAKSKEEEKLRAEELKEEIGSVTEEVVSNEVEVVASGDVFTEMKATPKSFRWPWQKEPETEEIDSEPEVQDALTETEVQDEVTEEAAEAKVDELPSNPKPLSPYAQYPDFKPPSSPTPSDPVVEEKALDLVAEVVEIATGEPEKTEEAPPAPSPENDEGAKEAEEELQRLAAQARAEAKAREGLALEKAKASAATFLWPWQKPKPVENETPSKPDTELSASPIQSETEPAVVSSSSTSSQDELPRPTRPLSPYTRYPGLRPPSSPTPSAPTVVSEAESISETESAPTTEELTSNNG